MGNVGGVHQFFKGKTEEDDDDDDKDEWESRPNRYNPYRIQLGHCSNGYGLPLPRKSHDPIHPIQIPGPTVTYQPPLLQNLLISSPGNDSATDSSLESAPVNSALNDPDLPYKNTVLSSSSEESVVVSVPNFTASLSYTTADKAIRTSSVLKEKGPGKNKSKQGTSEEIKEEVVIKRTVTVHEGRWIKHYCSRQRILLVGDGDFSFSACLATAFRNASNMIATSLNTEEFLKKNYGKAASNLKELRKRQCKVMHGIDATKIAAHELLGHLTFDRIIFNFPFAGFFKDLSLKTQLRRHRRLVSLFLKNVKEMVSESGEIHISHKTNGIHVEWKLEGLASSHGLRLIEAVSFNLQDYPGYNTKRGFGGDKNFHCYPSKTFKFGLKCVPS